MALLEAHLLAGKEEACFRGFNHSSYFNKPRGEFILFKSLVGIGGLFLILQNCTPTNGLPSALVANDLKINDFFSCSVGINTTRCFCGLFYNLEKNKGKHLGLARGTSNSGTHLGQASG